MITFKSITIRNFLSVGAVCQAIKLDTSDLTLVLGENLDLGGAGNRNGVGKTTMIQALSYVLFGASLNSIRKDNLINRTNAKNMMVTLEFSSKGVDYKIERGRKPNILKFYVNDKLVNSKEDKNEAQGENKETQAAIEHAIGMSFDMFKHIVTLNTYSTPFLAMGSGEQRKIIEQLLGITLLSEKAELVKANIKQNIELIQQEDFRNKTIEESNKRVQEQIDSLKRRQRLWTARKQEELNALVNEYDELSKVDIDAELQAHRELSVYLEKQKMKDTCEALVARQTAWKQKRARELQALQIEFEQLGHIDIDQELNLHALTREYDAKKLELKSISTEIQRLEASLKKEQALVNKLETEIQTLEENKCYACGQDFHDENHITVMSGKRELLSAALTDIAETKNLLEEYKKSIFDLGQRPKTFYASEAEAFKHSSVVDSINQQIEAKKSEIDPYQEQILEHCDFTDIGSRPITHYDTEAEAIEHRSVISGLLAQIERKNEESDPYSEQIHDMENKALQQVSFDKINELTKLGDHYKFLYDILTSKDSFVRKKIVDQNLSYLNLRLSHYLDKIGLPHTVVFKNDLSVEITELGRELDFGNLSRGECNRLILALSFAFRDVWENLFSPINTIFIDELIDSGMDSVGVENSIAILKDLSRTRSKSVWLVSHREELAGRVPQVLKVVKEHGFTSYNTSTDIE